MLARGRFSSMMDMGGVAAADSSNTKLNLGKNNRVKLVALDFALLTQSIQSSMSHSNKRNSSAVVETRGIEKLGQVQPDISMVQSFAKMLNVTLN